MRVIPTRWLKCCVLALLLFAQAALALDACVSANAKANDAFVAMPADCDMAPAQVNLCLMQCLAGDQIDGDARIPPLTPPLDVVLRLPRDPASARAVALHLRGSACASTGPPLSQLCRLLL